MELNIWISRYHVHGKDMFSCGGMHSGACKAFDFTGRGETAWEALSNLLSHLMRH